MSLFVMDTDTFCPAVGWRVSLIACVLLPSFGTFYRCQAK